MDKKTKEICGNILFLIGMGISLVVAIVLTSPYHGHAAGIVGAAIGAPLWILGVNIGSWFN